MEQPNDGQPTSGGGQRFENGFVRTGIELTEVDNPQEVEKVGQWSVKRVDESVGDKYVVGETSPFLKIWMKFEAQMSII